jgi:hypothetical protein
MGNRGKVLPGGSQAIRIEINADDFSRNFNVTPRQPPIAAADFEDAGVRKRGEVEEVLSFGGFGIAVFHGWIVACEQI